VAYFSVIWRPLSGGVEENHEKNLRIAGVLAENRTDNFPNISQEAIPSGLACSVYLK
jgi:hypothetical protein